MVEFAVLKRKDMGNVISDVPHRISIQQLNDDTPSEYLLSGASDQIQVDFRMIVELLIPL